MIYLKQASLTTLNFEAFLFFVPFNKNLGDTAKVAFNEICCLIDLSSIFLKQIQLFGIIIPGQEVHKPINNPENIKSKDFISSKIKN